jgi:hypothetical protein
MLWQTLLLTEVPKIATAIIGSAVIGGASQAIGASSAADAQSDAANASNRRLDAQYNQTRADLQPFRDAGYIARDDLITHLGEFTKPVRMDQNALEQTPGYQFTKTQGLKAVQNSAAARGLGASGAAQKGAADFATGLANNTYKDQFNMEVTNTNNAYNRLMGLVNIGQNSAAQTGDQGGKLQMAAAGNTVGAGDAQAASYNRMGNAASGAANNIGSYYAYQGMYGNNPLTGGVSAAGVSGAGTSGVW